MTPSPLIDPSQRFYGTHKLRHRSHAVQPYDFRMHPADAIVVISEDEQNYAARVINQRNGLRNREDHLGGILGNVSQCLSDVQHVDRDPSCVGMKLRVLPREISEIGIQARMGSK